MRRALVIAQESHFKREKQRFNRKVSKCNSSLIKQKEKLILQMY